MVEGETIPELIPSQAVQSNNASAASSTSRNGRRRGGRRGRQKNSKSNTEIANKDNSESQSAKSANEKNEKKSNKPNNLASAANKKKKHETTSTVKNNKPANKKNKRSNKRKPKNSWRKLVKGIVDPISLEPLDELPYPPFALAIQKPYVPIPFWPIPKAPQEKEAEKTNSKEVLQKRQKEILEAQWGSKILGKAGDSNSVINAQQSQKSDNIKDQKQHEHVHLYDGQALAYYLVSQLQFIDPLNRRDLTRDELVNLDSYLKRYKLQKGSVVEAYDEKGITVNTAGAAAQTRQGRAELLQQEARALLNALFHSNEESRSSVRNNTGRRRNHGRRQGETTEVTENQFARQYAAYGTGAQNDNVNNSNSQNRDQMPSNDQLWNNEEDDMYEYVGGSGMLIIDDNANPGLRGTTYASNTISISNEMGRSSNAQPFSSHVHRTFHERQENNFPALPTSADNGSSNVANALEVPSSGRISNVEETKKVSKTLKKIGNLVERTNRKQIQKQKKAREEALRKMELANLPFEEYLHRNDDNAGGLDLEVEEKPDKFSSCSNLLTSNASEGQLERNRNFASALGVLPSTVRNQTLNSGWKRPIDTTIDKDEFGNELNNQLYPDELIIKARERMTFLLKIEKKWISWLNDDKAASCPLNSMDKPTRIFVHKYSDFWNIHTQSFDPEPRRYIHCVKVDQTHAPCPLLSHAVKTWRGPGTTPVQIKKNDLSQQTAGQSTLSSKREFPQTEVRVPLKLDQRVIQNDTVPPPGALFEPLDYNLKNMPASSTHETAPRFSTLLANRERIKLKLDPRTKPLNLPPFKSSFSSNQLEFLASQELENEKELVEEERRRKILTAAFASDDEESSDSEWEEEEAMYSGKDEE